jgi:hypothetical protein
MLQNKKEKRTSTTQTHEQRKRQKTYDRQAGFGDVAFHVLDGPEDRVHNALELIGGNLEQRTESVAVHGLNQFEESHTQLGVI